MTSSPIQYVGELATAFAELAKQPFEINGAYDRTVEELNELKELARQVLDDPIGFDTTYSPDFQEKFLKELADCIYTHAYFVVGGYNLILKTEEDLDSDAVTPEVAATTALEAAELALRLRGDMAVVYSLADDIDHLLGREAVVEIVEKVHKSNLSKIGPDGAVFNDEGKIMKSSFYLPPNLSGIAAEVASVGLANNRHLPPAEAA